MINKPKPGDWLQIGFHDVIVYYVNEKFPNEANIIFLDDRDRAMATEAIFDGEKWRYKHDGPHGIYADKFDRYYEFVKKLRLGRHYDPDKLFRD